MNSLLSFLGLAPTPPHEDEYGSHLPVSCPAWSVPDPAVRLRQTSSSAIRVFGFPEPADIPPGLSGPFPSFGNSGPLLLYLRGKVPAYVDYVMGHDWQSRLRSDYGPPGGIAPSDGKVILREDEPQRGERGHCLRMRRCGAVGVRSDPDIDTMETNGPRNPEQFFGWPADGGVWILRSYDGDKPFGDSFLGIGDFDITALDKISERFYVAAQSLKRQSDMGGVCHVIEQAGGQFYASIGDCPEAVRLELCA